MKIYLFNPESGVYLGEDFADGPPMCPGRRTIPSHATTVTPPPFRPGEAPIFNAAENRWVLHPASHAVTGVGGEQGLREIRLCRQQDPTSLAPDIMKTVGLTMLVALIVMYFSTVPLHAVSFPPSGEEPTYLKDQEVMKVGALVHLFHSGTEDVRSAIKVNDVLTVYREYPPDISGISKASGKVKVIGMLGNYYFEGEVVEGYVLPGYQALKGTVSCLVTTRFKPKR